MTQRHFEQHGIFHVTSVTKGRVPGLTLPGVPEILIDNLRMSMHLYGAFVRTFCILPDHLHCIVTPGEKGLSRFMQSFKSHSMVEIRANITPVAESNGSPLRKGMIHQKQIGKENIFWQKGFHDERLRDDPQVENAVAYVEANAWKHGLVQDPFDWPWSSLRIDL